MLELPKRESKPRNVGLTSLHDVSYNINELKFLLEDFAEFIDIAKIGVGTAYVMPRMDEKIKLYQSYGIKVYFGGTLFEKFYSQNKLEEYKKFMKDKNVDWVEISCGTINISIEERIALVKDFSKDFNVLSEVGSKDNEKVMPPSKWNYELSSLLDVGCKYVITEGRNSGTAGVYRPTGEIRTGLISDIIKDIDVSKIIFEAPNPKAQMYFINEIGANVNLGNINPKDVLLLETQRKALRSETFFNK